MAIAIHEPTSGLLEVRVTGKLGRADYEEFVPVLDRAVEQHEQVRILVDLHDFHGWTVAGLWEDAKFDANHPREIDRLAVVGDQSLREFLVIFFKPFATTTIRYFNHAQEPEARAWLREGLALPV